MGRGRELAGKESPAIEGELGDRGENIVFRAMSAIALPTARLFVQRWCPAASELLYRRDINTAIKEVLLYARHLHPQEMPIYMNRIAAKRR